MRRLSVIVAALLMAGCQVDVEGAPCEAPGATEQCPSGQACGQDLKCSVRAAACAGTMCAGDAQRCQDGAIAVCDTSTDAVCGEWKVMKACTALGQVCARDAIACEAVACDTLGSTEQCPSGQACGQNFKCSVQAAACAEICSIGELRCEDGPAATIRECNTSREPVCGSWEPVDTCEPGLVCGPGATCACAPVMDRAFYFDAARPTLEGVTPTGAASPAGCRLDDLAEALQRATAAGPGSRAVAAAPTSELVLDGPLELPAGVTLTTTAPGDPTRHVLAVGSLATSATAAIVLRADAALEGFTLRNDGATTGVGVAFACDGEDVPALRQVDVLAKASDTAAFATGIAIGGGCGAELHDVGVSGASGVGLSVDAGASAPPTTVVDSTFERNGTGIVLRSGTLSIDGSQIEANVRRGFWAKRRDGAGPYPIVALAIEDTSFIANGDTGLKLEDLPDDSKVALSRIEITANHATTSDSTHALGRLAGGLVLQGKRPASFALKGSRIYGNDADQIGMWASPAWDLSGTATPPAYACAAPNVFACPAADAYLVYSSTLNAPAFHNIWDPNPPGSVVVNVDYASNCPDPVPSLLPACAP